MTAPDGWEALTRRVEALETDHFELDQQVRRLADATDRNTAGLDVLEESLDEITATAPDPEALAAALSQRQAQLDGDLPTDSGGGPAGGARGPFEAVANQPLPFGELVLADQGLVAMPLNGAGGQPPPGPTPPPQLAVLHAWVEEHIAPLVRRTTTTGEGGGVRWCRRWWEHLDAVDRFQALFLAFGELSGEESATWLSVYLRDHLDPHMATLTSPFGPFYACHPTHHSDTAEKLGQDQLPGQAPTSSPVPARTVGQP